MLHDANDNVVTEDAATMNRNRRVGLVLFTVYLVFYAAFVGLNAFRPDLFERPAVAGLNLAIVFGFALILAAFVLALLYGLLCRLPVRGASTPEADA